MKSTIPLLAGLGLILGGVLPASALPSEELRKSYCEDGFVAFTWGKFGEAERLFHLAMLEADEAGVKDTMYAVSLHGRARAFDMLGSYADADEHYKRALALHERLNGGDSEYVAEIRGDITKLNEKLSGREPAVGTREPASVSRKRRHKLLWQRRLQVGREGVHGCN